MILPGSHSPATPSKIPFFLRAAEGTRFCLFHPPAGLCRGALVYLHPFAEEMNKTRRMAALQSRALAAQGVGVLQIDLLGCGDSSGDFGDARWELWRDDVALAMRWLRERLGREVGLWGLRLGALLAADCARSDAEGGAMPAADRLLMWHPVHTGGACLTQFLRMRLAADMLDKQHAARNSTAALRAALRAGAAQEVAGYELTPALADALDGLELAVLRPSCPVHWLDVAVSADRPMSPASNKIVGAWREQGVLVDAQVVAGPAFWGTAEIAECPALLEATGAALAGAIDVV
ncbi:hydrolase 2, exosortase A system-associated [Pseudoduganella namucuonensis]|uniref:Exosortase A system-associated hydrolase 2 n=1 Tax=Pseudoduganella namucuonensis TaxID=1035707 RepID=A0A1I7GH56_9BURK|nr:hydrolase 2, exosortase A system-associated [Pseudoduganella namucuonensis]SFU47641.1 exosortase A system-associated hydrolase 2 [Pseudoduganella namucuonensis]